MGLFDKAKKGILAAVDKDARDQVREERAKEANERFMNRLDREQQLKEKNLEERLERRKMLSGEKPLSVREFGKSKLREGGRELKISASQTFTRENAGYAIKSGAKTGGALLKKGAQKAVEYERAAEAREKKRERKGKSSYGGFSSGNYMNLLSDTSSSRGRKQREGRQPTSSDIQSSLLGSGKGASASDITNSLLGTGGSGKKRKSRKHDPFDFSDYY